MTGVSDTAGVEVLNQDDNILSELRRTPGPGEWGIRGIRQIRAEFIIFK